MIIRDVLKSTKLPRLDAEVLLAHAIGVDRTWIHGHDDEPISSAEEERWQHFESRRLKAEPVAYITGTKEFFGRPFKVTKDVLIPRPSTEALCEIALSFLKKPSTREEEVDTDISVLSVAMRPGKPTAILDIGTGSGVVAITLALEKVQEKIIAVDTSEEALKVAKENAEKLKALHRIEFALVDGPTHVASFAEPFIIVSNPPYIPEGITLEKDVADYEPHDALFSGADGLNVIRQLAISVQINPLCLGIVLELRSDQIPVVAALLGV